MADKQMNQFTTATDGAYIYAEASNGSQVKISKSDLIAALGLSGTILKKKQTYLDPEQTTVIENVQGLVFTRNNHSYGGYLLYLATFNEVSLITNPVDYGNAVELSMKGGDLTVKNTGSGRRLITIYYQSLGY